LGLPELQLYNLNRDPGEEKNLIREYPEVAEHLDKLLQKYKQEGRSVKFHIDEEYRIQILSFLL